MGFLLELIKDAEIWLELEVLNPGERQYFLARLTPTVRYWYEYLFPTWFRAREQKFYIWKQKLRAGEFHPTDTQLIKAIAEQIQQRHGNVVHRCYIADFSMATDVIVSSEKGLPLCVQITTLADEYSQMKYDKWESTLRQWNIEGGLFVSFNSNQEKFIVLVNLVLDNSKNLPNKNYLRFPWGE